MTLVSSTISGKRRGRCEQLEIERDVKTHQPNATSDTFADFSLGNPAVKRH